MSAADEHHADALDAIANANLIDREDVVPRVLMGLISAALAIEARLGELVEQQRIANALSGTGRMGVFDSDAEIAPAREAVRKLLGLSTDSEGAAGFVHIPPGTTREQIEEAFARYDAVVARARMTGQAPAAGR
ncbi:hypothetical protein ATM97_06970 [Nocardia sp. MH4]|uniref:hypothetical protein n=1 Tax=Nocardia sp. MH4 TaxID=1768677 RepID=UPI001C4F3F4C|nr:hypothetical protein [Nocardia sp. MH4]MBW0270755.1 hypothetical protein [Nocardia sp. MH4]